MLSANKMLFYYHLCFNIIYLTRLFEEPLIINRTIIIILKNMIPTETDENFGTNSGLCLYYIVSK